MKSDEVKRILWETMISDDFSFEYEWNVHPAVFDKTFDEWKAEIISIYSRKPEGNYARVFKRKNSLGQIERGFSSPERQPTLWGFLVVIGDDANDLTVEWRFHDPDETSHKFPTHVGHRVRTYVKDGVRVFDSEGYDREYLKKDGLFAKWYTGIYWRRAID